MKMPTNLLLASGLMATALVLSPLPLEAQQKSSNPAKERTRQIAGDLTKTPGGLAGVMNSISPVSGPSGLPSGEYRIGAGDTLQIGVWKEPQASVPSAVVRSDGRISLPLIKEVHVLGLTPAEAEKVLVDKYSHFISSPDVSVVVKEIRSERVYVIGGVKKQGSINLYAPMTVMQVLAEAGGLSEYAKRSEIYVLRSEGDKELRLPFDYRAQLKGKSTGAPVMVRSGDTVVVPE